MLRYTCALLSLFVLVSAAAAWAADAPQAPAPEKPAADAPAPPAPPAPEAPSEVDMAKVSYCIGTQMGTSLKNLKGMEWNRDKLVQGMQDALDGKQLEIPEAEMRNVMQEFKRFMGAKRIEEQKKQEVEQKAFLEENAKKEGVVTLPSGLQYKVITEGKGKSPAAADKVKVNYRGTLIDGTEFDSSYKRNTPFETPLTGVIKGWTEALQLMKEGAKWQIFVPADLAYGTRGFPPQIGPNQTLIFEIELIEVVSTGEVIVPSQPAAPAPDKAPALK